MGPGNARLTKEMAMTKPLQNVRVLDLTVALAGPFCTQKLASMGAEVIRIEPPWGGYHNKVFEGLPRDLVRRLLGPDSANKKNVTLNLRKEKGKEIFLELVKKSDVVLQNFSPGTMEKMGLGYEVLKETNARIIYCAISGFGQDGPWRDRVAYDTIIQAVSGMMSINGFPDREPVKVGTSVCDYFGGLYAALGIMYALYARDTITGEGQMIDCAMLDATLSVLQEGFAISLLNNQPLKRAGNQYPLASPAGIYRTKDNKFEYITGQTEAQWNAVMNAIGRQDLIDNGWKLQDRVRHGKEVDAAIEAWTLTKTRQEIEDILMPVDVPCAPVMDLVEVSQHPQTKARKMLTEVKDMYGTIDGILGVVPKLMGTPGSRDWGIMETGAFNRDVYGTVLDMSEDDMAKLKREQVI
jgi:crotonobetainyl-CoA:carnitine CoA-transferase CaiB-like acyl-CoA transferase